MSRTADSKAPRSGAVPPGDSATPTKRRLKPPVVIFVVVLAIVGTIGIAAARQAQKEPGALFTTERGFGMILGPAEPKAELTQPIVLQEGGDVKHELSHILGPLRGYDALARGLVMRDGSAVVVTYDPDRIVEAEIIQLLRETGYVK